MRSGYEIRHFVITEMDFFNPYPYIFNTDTFYVPEWVLVMARFNFGLSYSLSGSGFLMYLPSPSISTWHECLYENSKDVSLFNFNGDKIVRHAI